MGSTAKAKSKGLLHDVITIVIDISTTSFSFHLKELAPDIYRDGDSKLQNPHK